MSSSLRVVKDLATGKKIITDAQGTALVLNVAGTVLDSSSSPAAPVGPAQTVSAAGAITVKEGLVWLTATGAAAVTLAAPAAADYGKILTICASSTASVALADANIVGNGNPGGAAEPYSFNAYDTLQLIAVPSGKWQIIATPVPHGSGGLFT
jgi:hypothetical protein